MAAWAATVGAGHCHGARCVGTRGSGSLHAASPLTATQAFAFWLARPRCLCNSPASGERSHLAQDQAQARRRSLIGEIGVRSRACVVRGQTRPLPHHSTRTHHAGHDPLPPPWHLRPGPCPPPETLDSLVPKCRIPPRGPEPAQMRPTADYTAVRTGRCTNELIK